jgi:hypothetical protein
MDELDVRQVVTRVAVPVGALRGFDRVEGLADGAIADRGCRRRAPEALP